MNKLHIGLTPEVGARSGSIIVKVQTALNDPAGPALVYGRGRTFMQQVPAESVTARMGGRVRAFFYARLSAGELVLGDEAPDQPW